MKIDIQFAKMAKDLMEEGNFTTVQIAEMLDISVDTLHCFFPNGKERHSGIWKTGEKNQMKSMVQNS